VFEPLGQATLATGERMELARVVGPDGAWAPRLGALLGHKPGVYRYHIEASLREPLGDLETAFYLGLVDGEPIAVAMVAGAHGAGVLGHVYTVPAWRRRGAARALHVVLAEDVARRGYQFLSLGTDPRGPARRIYEAIGFRAVAPDRGDMVWVRQDAVPPDGPWSVGPLGWADWGWVSEAALAPPAAGEELPRSLLFRVGDRAHVEAAFVEAMRRGGSVRVLRRGPRAVGWLALVPDAARALGATAVDLYVRPGWEEGAPRLTDGFPWPPGPLLAAWSGGPGYRARALAAAGFRHLGSWAAWWDLGRGAREPLNVWARG
jgi:GNAT superfamily N-acetyltransferase